MGGNFSQVENRKEDIKKPSFAPVYH